MPRHSEPRSKPPRPSTRRFSAAGACGPTTGRSAPQYSSRCSRAWRSKFGYFRRWLNNFTITDNLLTGPADYTAYSITAPSDPRLPGGGSYAVNGLNNVVQSKFGQTSNNITLADDIGDQYQRYNGMLLNVSARLGTGVQLQGGINTGKTVQDNCAVRAQVPELTTTAGVSPAVNPGNPYATTTPGSSPRRRHSAVTRCQGSMCSSPGPSGATRAASSAANWNAPVSLVSAALGRPAAVVGSTVPISLVAPGQVWGDRVNALDLRFAKILHFGRVRYNVGVDVINVTNSSAILTYNQNFNPAVTTGSQAWLAPQSVLTPRFLKIGAQIDF